MENLAWGAIASVWLYACGFVRALRWDTCLKYYIREPEIFVTTCSCILLNGVVFFGSIVLAQWIIQPWVSGVLTAVLSPSWAMFSVNIFHAAYGILWLLPAYIVSFFVNCVWYNSIAEATAKAAQKAVEQRIVDDVGVVAPTSPSLLQLRRPDALTGLSQDLYRSILLCVYFFVALLMKNIPVVGPFLFFSSLCWLYALYCFDYKWGLFGVPLELRTRAIEELWPYFAGFGTFIVALTILLPFYTGAAAAGILFPVFIVTAADADPKAATLVIRSRFARHGVSAGVGRLPIFFLAVWATNALLANIRAFVIMISWHRSSRIRPSSVNQPNRGVSGKQSGAKRGTGAYRRRLE